MNDSKIIKRASYIQKIKPFIAKPVIKVLTGQRRVGKSYILYQLIDEIKLLYPHSNIIYINIELSEFDFIKNHTDLDRYVESKLQSNVPNFLLVDEIQEISSFELCLRSLLAANKCDIYCTGSNAAMLSGELATTIAGRYVEIPIYALSYSEFMDFHKLSDSKETLLRYLAVGGMPFLIHTGIGIEIVNEYLKNIYSTIVLKDVIARYNIRNVSFVENLIAYLADNVGNIVSANNISKYLKSQRLTISAQTVMNYLKMLTDSFLIHKVQRCEIGGLKIFEIGEKYYFEDLGIRNSIRQHDMRNDMNKLLENVVYMHLIRQGYSVFIGQWGTHEIDFVAQRNEEKMYIQVAYLLSDAKTEEREFGNLNKISDHYPKYVVTMDEVPVKINYNGIKQMLLNDFLTSF